MVKVITETRNVQNSWVAMIGIPVAGLLWSLAVVWLNTEKLATIGFQPLQAFMYVALGGLAQTIALWAGFSAVVWAMVRAFSGRIPVMRLFTLVSSASLPLWVGVPAAAYWLYSDNSLNTLAAVLFSLSLCGFFYGTARRLAHHLNWPLWRALAVIASATVFLASFTFLNN